MQDNNFQDDFFAKGVSSRKPSRMPVLDGYVKQRYLPFIKIPTEYAVIAVIAVLILMTIFYALGVKIGRSSRPFVEASPAAEVLVEEEEEVVFSQTDESAGTYSATSDIVDNGGGLDLLSDSEESEEGDNLSFEKVTENLPKSEPTVSKSVYVIHLAAFREEDKANQLCERLKKSGTKAGVSKKSDWYQVYAEGYSTIDEANAGKEKLRKDYADCYIRKIQ